MTFLLACAVVLTTMGVTTLARLLKDAGQSSGTGGSDE